MQTIENLPVVRHEGIDRCVSYYTEAAAASVGSRLRLLKLLNVRRAAAESLQRLFLDIFDGWADFRAATEVFFQFPLSFG